MKTAMVVGEHRRTEVVKAPFLDILVAAHEKLEVCLSRGQKGNGSVFNGAAAFITTSSCLVKQ